MIPRVLVLCTVTTGLDALAQVLRNDLKVEAIVGVHPEYAKKSDISGYTDIRSFSARWGIKHIYVHRYDLNDERDKTLLSSLSFDLIWVCGWQRLIPGWLIEMAALGALGAHGSPDGIHGGRGRSPQNWAIMLGCHRFDLAVFRITPGIDDGPVVLERAFFYNETDDISISYKKTSICCAEMMIEILRNPRLIQQAVPQTNNSFYYPQRKPEDGYADWNLGYHEIWAHCRALTKPYPGLRTTTEKGNELIIWSCLPFDDQIMGLPGEISFVFEDGSFLAQTKTGRLLINDFEFLDSTQTVSIETKLQSEPFSEMICQIIERHSERYPNLPVARRIQTYK